METIIPRNNPGSQSMTQDNEQKMPTQMSGVDNYAGKESGESTTAGYETTTGQTGMGVEYNIHDVNVLNATRQPYLNIAASEENRSAKFKYPSSSQEVPPMAKNQYE